MCKQVFLTNVSKLKTSKLKRLLKSANEHLQVGERDGFGWVARNKDGTLVGERCVDPTEYQFKLDKEIFNAPFVSKAESNQFGKLGVLKGPLLIHGRTSTNDKTIVNTHPFLKNGWALVHNGVVENDSDKYEMQSTCDSEHLIQHMSTIGITGIEQHITGYYAFGAIDPKGMLHVVKDSIAGLHCTYIKSIDSLIFASTRDLLEDICEEMAWKTATVEPVSSNVHLMFKGNELVSQTEIKPRGRSNYADKFASKSLAYLNNKQGGHIQNYFDKYDSGWQEQDPFDSTEFAMVKKEHAIICADGTEIDFEDFQWLPREEKLRCAVYEANGNQIMFNTESKEFGY